ncbi:galanin-like G-protein coupled receptor npr-9 [Aplysia californica]|uniref:Galanin-like G-protein coupled receptor npr-9 n=1 Tax=Aplysia californica TaxID=6500 RepID=A0ABM1A787_APLCA|nr:galanin-like G-protein coupled receptor npr-9 [Aplysia californica]
MPELYPRSLTVSAGITGSSESAPSSSNDTSSLLADLNHEQAILQLPITAFLTLLMSFGVTGNACVIYVYRTRFRKTSGSYFIMILAILDLLNSGLCIPWEIYVLSNSYLQDHPVLCRVARFVATFVYISAGLILVCVAFSRLVVLYFKIVKPLHCYSSGQAQSLTVVVAAIALCLVWPQLALSGTRTVETRIPGLYGHDCSISDQMQRSIYPILFHGCLYGVFTLCFALLTGFYMRIVWVVWRRGGNRLGEQVAHRDYTPRSSASNASDRSFGSSQNVSVASRSQAGHHHRTSVLARVGRTTRMLGLVTFVFLLGYVPFLTVHVIYLLGMGFQRPMDYSQQLLYQLCLRSYFLSSAANPLIYSILNVRFRKESMVALKSVILRLPKWIRRRIKGEHEVT